MNKSWHVRLQEPNRVRKNCQVSITVDILFPFTGFLEFFNGFGHMWMKNMFTAVAEIPLEDTFLGCSGNFGHQLLCWIGFNDNIGVGLPQGSRTCSNCFIGKELCTFNYEVMGFRPDEHLLPQPFKTKPVFFHL